MVKIVTKTVVAALILMLCSGVLFAQKETPNYKKSKSEIKQRTAISVDRQQGQSSILRGDVIYSEEFEDTPYFSLPDEWQRFVPDWDDFLDPEDYEDNAIWIVVNNSVNVNPPGEQPGNVAGILGWIESYSGEQFFVLSWIFCGENSMVITNGFELVAGQEYEGSFWLEMPGYDWEDGSPIEENAIKVTIGQTPTYDGMDEAAVVYEFEGLIEYYEEATFKFVPETSGTYYLAFKDTSFDPWGEGWGIYIAIDDIKLVSTGEVVDECDPVTNLEVEYNDDCEAVLTWDAPEGAELFNIYRDGEFVAEVDETTFTDVDFDATVGHNWAVTVVCEMGESVEVTVVVNPCYVGISKQSGKISIYPNPARNLVYIDGANIVKVEVYNMLGQLIDSQKGKVKSIDVSKYNSGTYLFKAYDVNNNAVITNITVTK